MRNIFTLKTFGLLSFLFFIPAAQANDKIDRDTETAIPRSKNLYGIGVAVLPKTSGSDEFRVMALPIINANYADRYYINALQAGVWILDSDDKRLRLGLAAQARFGWDAGDGRLTKGMRDRDFTVEIGPALRWQTGLGTINAQWGLDAGGASNGQTIDLQFIRNLYRDNAFKLNGSMGLTWSDKKFNDYYFGVTASEALPSRPEYSAGSSVEYKAGLNGSYLVGANNFILFGTSITRLGNQQAESPIVETRLQPFAYLGYSIAY